MVTDVVTNPYRGIAELLSMRVVGICCSAFESPMSHRFKIAVKPVTSWFTAIFA